MSGADQYSVLFEPVQIGPVMAKNRFYQVPHCNGLGHLRPQAEAAMRAMKAEGGWAVVSTQEAEIHPTSDLSPYSENRIWDERDIPALRLITNAVKDKGSLAAIQLAHNGHHAQNHLSRAPLLAPSEIALETAYPKQARAMDKSDIREFRKWHRAAARRSREAGFDIVYIYAGHHMTLPHHFLLPQFNDRSDEYGGSLENRVRLTRELLEETKEEVGEDCAVALRFAVDEMLGADGMQAQEEGRAVVELLSELPDLWDVNVADWSNDSATTRFEPRDGFQSSYVEFVKQVTSKPVVGVGRLTSPDLMVSLVKKGILDFIGAARPSIADPFLPNKIKEGRIEEVRECIGCNICVSSDSLGVPIRCTQNPTMGEEWRRKWHPEIIESRGKEDTALVVGSGPAGLECAMQLARRGYEVTLAEAKLELGGRVLQESGLAGLSAWKRVADHRIYDLQQRGNAQLFTDSRLTAQEVVELETPNVFLATGATWRRDGRGKSAFRGVSMDSASLVFTPDDIMSGVVPEGGRIMVYDDDQGYLGGVLADHLAQAGQEVIFVSPASMVSPFTELTLEQTKVQRSLLEKGVRLALSQALSSVAPNQAILRCVYTGREQTFECDSVVLVTQRARETTLYDELRGLADSPLTKLELIGDAANPGLIADAVYAGHMAARNLERDAGDIEREFFRREIVSLENV
ncbi:FAD-dependent oxidoreductase [Ruegeria arenilitoris]|uniref:oxidoreductase n=1 Tax=Ruegeria arenilitoris TaxID=1173585 RepID=UPI00147B09DA|nr:FAD-dependent oxidoreductase [Ruegeria arenilitoris]